MLTLVPHQQTVPRSSDAAARKATVSDPDVALLSSPKLSGAPAPNRATRATIALPESDRPDGREPAMPLPRFRSRGRGRPEDRIRVSRPRRSGHPIGDRALVRELRRTVRRTRFGAARGSSDRGPLSRPSSGQGGGGGRSRARGAFALPTSPAGGLRPVGVRACKPAPRRGVLAGQAGGTRSITRLPWVWTSPGRESRPHLEIESVYHG